MESELQLAHVETYTVADQEEDGVGIATDETEGGVETEETQGGVEMEEMQGGVAMEESERESKQRRRTAESR